VSFVEKPNEDEVLRVSDTGLKIRASLVQFHPGHFKPVELDDSSTEFTVAA
jgi:hypothetical protein